MRELTGLAILIGAGALTFFAWQSVRARRIARERLGEPTNPFDAEQSEPLVVAEPFIQPQYWIPYLLGALLAFALYFFVGWYALYSVTFGLIVVLLGSIAESWRVERRIVLIESQLADALDLMIGALHAGVSVTHALDAATRESRPPLRPQLDNVLGRIRYGDDPLSVLRTLEQQVPLPTFRLFASALSVHWEVGGSLTGPLAIVARTTRDRIELGRRVRSLTVQSRASIAAILLTTYFIGIIMWRNNPERMVQFLTTTVGQWFAAGAIVLQVVGIAWSSRLSRMTF